jgi:hypothetical protein
MRSVPRAFSALVLLTTSSGCELTETTITEPEAALVAEVYVELGSMPGEHRVTGFIHGTVGRASSPMGVAESVRLWILTPSGTEIELAPAEEELCVDGALLPPDWFGDCYVADPMGLGALRPGDRLELTIERATGALVRGVSEVPDDFGLTRPVAGRGRCVVPGSSLVDIVWTSSPGARAYVSETKIVGLLDALPASDADTLELLGLSISATDTSIVFPAEFGVFDRFDLEREIALALQEGLPDGTRAEVFISAADQNYVNWARGGNFNPSGQVRIPSLQGDGFGVFGSIVRRSLSISTLSGDGPPCGV